MTQLRGQEAWSLALLRTHGSEAEAVAYLAALNRVQVAFGREPYPMPAAASVGLPDLVKCDAMSVSDVLGEQVERELRRTLELGDAARAARATTPSGLSRSASSCQYRITIARKSA